MTLDAGASVGRGLAADARSLDALKFAAGGGSDPKAVREAARQFESLFMRELIKSMREA
ncbi:MAG: flagellar assembly peptidoglycan hydrolase FlgJ, partial [Comamonadaceae bacterium]